MSASFGSSDWRSRRLAPIQNTAVPPGSPGKIPVAAGTPSGVRARSSSRWPVGCRWRTTASTRARGYVGTSDRFAKASVTCS